MHPSLNSSAAWALCLLFLPVLYVLAWPPIEMHFAPSWMWSRSRIVYATPTGEVRTWGDTREPMSEPWAQIAFAPLHRMRHASYPNNPINAYWNWWLRHRI
jgi:hypothetical protein